MRKPTAMNLVPLKKDKNKTDYLTIYNTKGYVVVDDFLPLEYAEKLHEMYNKETEWEQQNQIRERHYSHVFKTEAKCLPNENEQYIARFGRSTRLEKDPEFTSIYEKIVKQRITDVLGINLTVYDPRCYRLVAGDLYRTHIDAYAGDVGLNLYLSKNWVWDWGGILHICGDDENAESELTSILPKFNRAVLLNHGMFKFPHFISSVEPHALEPRYTIISFNR